MATKPAVTPDEDCYTDEQLQPLLEALQAVKSGDFTARLPLPKGRAVSKGILHQISQTFNDVVDLNERRSEEMLRLSRTVGREGNMSDRANLKGALGSWSTSVEAVNSLVEDLARPTTEVSRVITAVANGDLTQKMALEIEGTPIKGEFRRIGTTVNTMVAQLSSFAAEVSRVAHEVGTQGELGGEAEVEGISGTWKDLTDNVNNLAGNLTVQLRDVSKVATAIANGDLSQKITVDVKGEVLQIKDVINQMVDSLSIFAAEVTRVARVVGTEGKASWAGRPKSKAFPAPGRT